MPTLEQRIRQLEQENKRLRRAVLWYGNTHRWIRVPIPVQATFDAVRADAERAKREAQL